MIVWRAPEFSMGFFKDFRALYHLTFPSPQGQRADVEEFRQRLHKGREHLFRSLPTKRGAVWVDFGVGDGSNIEHLSQRISSFDKVYVVNPSKTLVKAARERFWKHGWRNAEAVEGDAGSFVPAEGHADVVTFCYSLTMMPDWFGAIDHAYEVLRPGGLIGVLDFYVSRGRPARDHVVHPASTRSFWPAWLSRGGVHASPDHLPYLERRFKTLSLSEKRGEIPSMPLFRPPYYKFIGEKPRAKG